MRDELGHGRGVVLQVEGGLGSVGGVEVGLRRVLLVGILLPLAHGDYGVGVHPHRLAVPHLERDERVVSHARGPLALGVHVPPADAEGFSVDHVVGHLFADHLHRAAAVDRLDSDRRVDRPTEVDAPHRLAAALQSLGDELRLLIGRHGLGEALAPRLEHVDEHVVHHVIGNEEPALGATPHVEDAHLVPGFSVGFAIGAGASSGTTLRSTSNGS